MFDELITIKRKELYHVIETIMYREVYNTLQDLYFSLDSNSEDNKHFLSKQMNGISQLWVMTENHLTSNGYMLISDFIRNDEEKWIDFTTLEKEVDENKNEF